MPQGNFFWATFQVSRGGVVPAAWWGATNPLNSMSVSWLYDMWSVFCQIDGSPVSKLCVLLRQKRGGWEGRTKRRMAMKIATVASVTYLRSEQMWLRYESVLRVDHSQKFGEELEEQHFCLHTLLGSWRSLWPSRGRTRGPLRTTRPPAEWREPGHLSLQTTWAPANDAAHGSHYRQRCPSLSSRPHSPRSSWSWRDCMGKIFVSPRHSITLLTR